MLIKDVSKNVGKEVTFCGWLNNKRSSGKVHFLEIRDGTGYIQSVYADADTKILDTIGLVAHESSVSMKGIVNEHPRKPGTYELQLTGIEIISQAIDFPISKKEHGPEFLLANRHLWLRSKKQWAIMRIRNKVIYSSMDFFHKENFIKIDAPIITPVACEGTTTLFDIDYFDLGKGYLSQSGQLYIEAAIFAHNRVYDFGPVFRAEKSNTRKHLIEFWMLDAEMAYCDHEQNMSMQEKFMKHVIKDVLESCKEELEILQRDTTILEKIIHSSFERMTHADVVKFLRSKGSAITDQDDLGAQDETILGNEFNKPIFIEKWPKQIKAFYMKRDPNNPNVVLGDDLIVPEGYGEIFGGSQREDNYDVLLDIMKEEKLSLDDFGWYLDLRKYGSVPHSGFGMGLERMVSWLSGTQHIRETIPFPRLLNRIRP
ncbi:MAG: asparagine--tRNA ligase [Oligoflexia bacterium]|nr:asparagine--tRNA ligase [Oligoflexia bacterium]